MVLAKQNGRSFAGQQQILDREIGKLTSQTERAAYSNARAVKVITGSPVLYGYLHLKSDIANLLPAAGNLFQMTGCEIGPERNPERDQLPGFTGRGEALFQGPVLAVFPGIADGAAVGDLISCGDCVGNLRVCEKTGKTVFFLYFILIAYFLLVPGPGVVTALPGSGVAAAGVLRGLGADPGLGLGSGRSAISEKLKTTTVSGLPDT